MAATSMMKEYVKRQLKYWLDNFKDDQLPRDFNAKTFSRSQITLHKITLKPDKIAALLHIPAPLIVTRATCSELSIKVPSWQLAEKFVQEPLSLKLGDLFVDIKHLDECDEHVRRDSIARAHAASFEPDPLGSIASMYQFATIIQERLELQVENVYLKLYEKHMLRVQVELAHFHARTTNALWQDMRDLTDCVDRSPDGLLKTRFKFISAQCSVYLHDASSNKTGPEAPPPLRLMRDHAIAMRMTLFGHRKSKHDTWEVLSRVVDLNLETLPFELTTAQVRQIYGLYTTLMRWMYDAAAVKSRDGADLLPHQVQRAPPSPLRKPASVVDSEDNTQSIESHDGVSTFALQITVRFTAHILLRIHSERSGDFQLAVIAQHAALNWIQHDDHESSTELQLTVHDVSVRHKDKVLFHVKPARDVLQVKRLPCHSIFVKWHVQKLECHVEKDIAVVVNELFHSLNEIEQAASITCGTCHHKIPVDTIATHVCSPPIHSNGSRHSSNGVKSVHQEPFLDSTQIPKLRLVLALDELEVVTDSLLFRSVHELMHSSSAVTPTRRFVLTMTDWSVSTESKEFVGDAIFVPVLPLAFQMLECTIRGCGCVQQQQHRRKQGNSDDKTQVIEGQGLCSRPRWPDRVFAELGQFAMRATDLTTQTETFLLADGASLRLSFSDGTLVCPRSTPQMSCLFHIERIRCQMDDTVYHHVRKILTQLQDPLAGTHVTALTLFFAVLEIRNVELTLLNAITTGQTLSPPSIRFKAQFRHVSTVADNHHGYLSLQTNLDFRALLQSESIGFNFTAEETAEMNEHVNGYVTKRERRRQRAEVLRCSSAQRIQRVFRRFVAERRRRINQELRRLTHEDVGDEPVAEIPLSVVVPTSEPPETESVESTLRSRRPSGAKPILFGSTEDLAAMHPMKMVAAAGVLKDGVLGFVKAKQHRFETEMTELAMQSKDTASRLLPKYSAMKNLLSPKSASPTTSSSSLGAPSIEKTIEIRDVESLKQQELEDEEVNGEASELQETEEGDRDRHEDDQEEDNDEQTAVNDNEVEEESQLNDAEMVSVQDEESLEMPTPEPTPPPLNATETLLASLPSIVRLVVQIEEHRLCVPIDPRLSVAVLGREIVRRFNEMFAQNGVISHVTLQSPMGGVLADSDIVGLVCDATGSSNELLFAYPHDEDATVKSVVHFDPTPTSPSPTKEADTNKPKGRAFARCSQLPLPLVVALLANESERDLLRHAMEDRGGQHNDEWPELALNASFLDPQREMLQVETRWPSSDATTKQSVHVANRDAFLLCLQQLGLCTSREHSKSVGKVLRDRLKMDIKNPLIRAACRASPEFSEETETTYANLMEIVQEDFGVYLRTTD